LGDLRYIDAGVDIDAGNRAVKLIKEAVASTHTKGVLGGLGRFAGSFELPSGYGQPVLVSSTDSVGTKVKVAIAAHRHRGIGIDLVNHCVNDIVTAGAEPLFFLDYFATGKLEPELLAELVDGAAEGLRHRRLHRRHRREGADHRAQPHRGRRRPRRAAQQRPPYQWLLAGALYAP
jgi:phosphoribosylformylglycinamidine cyclo-ligase